MALGSSFMNSISQMTQQELSNLPRAFRGQARDGAQVGPTPGKAQLFPLQKPVSNLRESPEWIWGFQKAVIFFSLALSLIEQLVHTSYMPSPVKEAGDWETESPLCRKPLGLGTDVKA